MREDEALAKEVRFTHSDDAYRASVCAQIRALPEWAQMVAAFQAKDRVRLEAIGAAIIATGVEKYELQYCILQWRNLAR